MQGSSKQSASKPLLYVANSEQNFIPDHPVLATPFSTCSGLSPNVPVRSVLPAADPLTSFLANPCRLLISNNPHHLNWTSPFIYGGWLNNQISLPYPLHVHFRNLASPTLSRCFFGSWPNLPRRPPSFVAEGGHGCDEIAPLHGRTKVAMADMARSWAKGKSLAVGVLF